MDNPDSPAQSDGARPPTPGLPPPLAPGAPPPPTAAHPVGRAPSSRRSGRGWKILAAILFVLLVVSSFSNLRHFLGEFVGSGGRVDESAASRLQEVLLERAGVDEKIAVLEIEGMISSFMDGGNMVESVRHQLKRAEADAAVKAVILRLNTPGGEVMAADEISRQLEEFQRRTGKPVVASMGGLAASGGYYVSAPCQWIVANELTITGSIGVIMHGYNYRGLMDKVGVRPEVYKSGKFKDMLSPDKAQEDISPQEREMVQGLIEETFQRFKRVIADGRQQAEKRNQGGGRKLASNWAEFADGRVFSGKQAFDLGFVDELGNFKTAVERARRLAHLAKADLIQYQRPFELGNLFRLFGQAETRSIKLDLGLDFPRLQAGQMYFLFQPGVR